MANTHYLETELYQRVLQDRGIVEFLDAGSLDGLWYWDIEHPEHEWLSPQFWRTLGFDPDSKQHLASEWQALMFAEDLAQAKQLIARHFADPSQPYDQVVRYRHQNGSTVWVRCRGVAIRDAQGKPVRMLGAHSNITDLQLTKQQLEASNERFQSLVEHSPDGVVVTNEQGIILIVNAQTEQMFGYRREQLLNQPVEVLMPERFRRIHTQHRAGYHQQPSLRQMGAGMELVGLHKSGAEFPIAISLNQMRINGEILVKSAIRDISAQRFAEAQIVRLNAELSDRNMVLGQLNQELEAFAYSVSHDLRAPLRAIGGFSNLLLDDYGAKLDAEARRMLGIICDNTVKMGRLIDELLTFSRLNRRVMEPQRVNMTQLAQAAFDAAIEQEPVRAVQFDLSPLPNINGDPAMMRQLWINLLSNAVKYSRHTPHAVIRVSAAQHLHEMIFSVADNGAGFDMKYAHKLFGVFERLHGDHEFEGTGVGLALVKRIVDRHGGRIWAHSSPGAGATFSFALPMEAQ